MLETTYFSRTEKDLTATKDIVRAACGPLLEIQPDETIRVIHHSFTEYLTGTTRSDRSVDYPVLKPGPTHKILALACLSYLESGCLSHVKERKQGAKRRYSATYDIEPSDDEPRLGEFELRLQYPFFEYATSNWHVHVIKSIKAGYDQEEVNKALRRFFDDGERLNTWLKQSWHGHKYCLDGVPLGAAEHGLNGVTQLHIAAELGLEPYIRELLQMGYIDVNAQDEVGRTPLWWAAWSGHAGVVRLLAQAGANPDQDDNYNGLKPLHKAVSVNHAEVVRVLLETGVSPMTGKSKEEPDVWCGTSPGTTGDTPLMV
jgi:ankyrin repeat protein